MRLNDWYRKRSSRHAFESLIDSLRLPADWTEKAPERTLLPALERVRSRKIVLSPLPTRTPVGLCGLWLARENEDVIMHRPSGDLRVWMHDVGHEAAHMLLGHGEGTTLERAHLASLIAESDIPDKDAISMTVRAGRGVTYSNDDEWDAEFFATLLMTRVRRDRIVRLF